MGATLPTLDEIRAVVTEAVAPLREEIARLKREQEPDDLTLAEAARWRRCSVRKIQRLVKEGKIHAEKIAGKRYVRKADLTMADPSEDEIGDIARIARRR